VKCFLEALHGTVTEPANVTKPTFLKSKTDYGKSPGIPCKEVRMDKSPGIIWKCLHNCNLQHISEKNPFQQTIHR